MRSHLPEIDRQIVESVIDAARQKDATREHHGGRSTGESAEWFRARLRRKREGTEPPDPVRSILRRLPEKAIRSVAAVMWIGRGDFECFADALTHSGGMTAENLAGYVGDKAPLSEYLTRGLERLNAESGE